MILFYKKQTGEIFATVDGRVHDEKHLNFSIDDGSGEEVGKYIIGWIEKGNQKVAYNMDKFELLQRFEDLTLFNPMNCVIIDGELTEKHTE